MSVAAALNALLLFSSFGVVRDEVVRTFQEHSVIYSGGRYENQRFNYRLFVPGKANDAGKLPLILWLHGYGENGSDNTAQLTWLDRVVAAPDHVGDYQFFILALQCPADNPMWHNADDADGSRRGSDDMCEVAVAALAEVMQAYPIDPDRIYLAGVSSGASGCWELAMRYPELFAAVTPMAGGPVDASRIERLSGLPIWVFHNARDPGTSIEYPRDAVAALVQEGGIAKLTETDGEDHDCWTSAFRDYKILNWMLAQRRGALGVPPGGSFWSRLVRMLSASWEQPVVVVPAGLLGLGAWTVWCFATRPKREHVASILPEINF